jgi:hypothetical protein
MGGDEGLDDGESESGAAAIPGAGGFDAIEAVEDAGQLIGGDAGALVGDFGDGVGVVEEGADFEGFVFGGVAEGVVDEVEEDAFEGEAIAEDGEGLGGVDGEGDVEFAGAGFEAIGGIAAEGAEVEGFAEFHLGSGVEAGEGEEVFGESDEAFDFLAAGFDGLAVFEIGAGPAEGDFEFTTEDGEGGAEFVGGIGDELLLGVLEVGLTVEELVEGGGEFGEFGGMGRGDEAVFGSAIGGDVTGGLGEGEEGELPLAEDEMQAGGGDGEGGEGTADQPGAEASEWGIALSVANAHLGIATAGIVALDGESSDAVRGAVAVGGVMDEDAHRMAGVALSILGQDHGDLESAGEEMQLPIQVHGLGVGGEAVVAPIAFVEGDMGEVFSTHGASEEAGFIEDELVGIAADPVAGEEIEEKAMEGEGQGEEGEDAGLETGAGGSHRILRVGRGAMAGRHLGKLGGIG